MIDAPQKFADHADKTITGITSLYLPEEEVLVGPEDIEKAHIVKGPSTFRKFRTWIFLIQVRIRSFFLLNTKANIQPVDIKSMIVTVVLFGKL